MDRVGIAELHPGMVLGETLYDDRGGVLLARGTQLTERLVDALALRGLNHVRVLDEQDIKAAVPQENGATSKEEGESPEPPRVYRVGTAPQHPRLPPGMRVSVLWGPDHEVPSTVVRSTLHVALLEAKQMPEGLRQLGVLIRLESPGDPAPLPARLAALGKGGRYLVSLGYRPIRRSPRTSVDLPTLVKSPALDGVVLARIVNLSETGARVQGVQLPIGEEVDLSFTPPEGNGGETDRMTVRGQVVRHIVDAENVEIGVHFVREIHRPR